MRDRGGTLLTGILLAALCGCGYGSFPSATAVGGSGGTPTIPASSTLVRLVILPASATLAPGGTAQFRVSGTYADSSTGAPAAVYSATGGTITASGLYTAGAAPGAFSAIATQQGGSLADTAAVTVTTVPPTALAVVTQPGGAVSGVPFTQQPVVELRDGTNQRVAQSGVVVTASKWTGPGTLGGTRTATTNAQGQAIFSGLKITGAGAYTLAFNAPGLSQATSGTVTVSDAVVTSLTLSPASVTVAPGGTQQFSVTGSWSDGSAATPAVTYSATGGAITPSGLFTAGSTLGSFAVSAAVVGRNIADTSVVTVVGAGPRPCQQLPYTRLVDVGTSAQLLTALSGARPGDLIVLADGTYGGSSEFRIRSVSGTAAQRITLCGSRSAVIDAGSLTNTDGLSIQNANFWTFTGFTITNALYGIEASGSSHNIVEGLEIHRIGQEAIEMYGFSRGNVIRGNRIYDTGLSVAEYGEGIYIGSSSAKWCARTACAPDQSDSTLIEGNTIGPDVRAEHIDMKEGTSAGEIRDNVMDGRGMIMSQSNWPSSWVIIAGNGYNIHDNVGTFTIIAGFRVIATVAGWGQNNVFGANTADVRGADYGFLIQTGATSAGNVVRCSNQVLNAAIGLANVPCQAGP
jgi:hypothetical protein